MSGMKAIRKVKGKGIRHKGRLTIFADNGIYIINATLKTLRGRYLRWTFIPVGTHMSFGGELTRELYDKWEDRAGKKMSATLA